MSNIFGSAWDGIKKIREKYPTADVGVVSMWNIAYSAYDNDKHVADLEYIDSRTGLFGYDYKLVWKS